MNCIRRADILRQPLIFFLLLGSVLTMRAQTTELTNLVVFVRFSDEAEIDHSFADIDTMFNGKTPGYYSVYNYYNVLTYGKMHYNTVYTNNIHNGVIVSYPHPRNYFKPYSPENPEGYQEPNPFKGVTMREAELLGRIVNYVDSLGLVDSSIILDGNNDGMLDNLSVIVKGATGAWSTILWPHMEYFPYDSLDFEPRINGLKVNTFNFEFEGSLFYFSPEVFCHELGHSLNLPDLYHYVNYQNVTPAGVWDLMCDNSRLNQIAAIYKNKILHVSDDPVEITEDGDYTLLSAGSSSSQNCYYIKSAIDPTQWFLLEYRNKNDLFENGIPGSGLIVARWNDSVSLDYNGMFANSLFDFYNQAHQYWIFRPGSSIDTVNGSINIAHFSQLVGRTSFSPNTDPHPYLTDGTPETSFEITDIYDHGDRLTFHVHFMGVGVEDHQLADCFRVYPNPATDVVNVECRMQNEELEVANMEVYDVYGKVVRTVETLRATSLQTAQINVSGFAAGMYFVRVKTDKGVVTKPFVKK